MNQWTSDQIAALAPDAKSLKTGQGLATSRKWPLLGQSELALWGECQGSGKKPYRTQIDLGEPAFKCSCPSRKFPCKHGLGLFLLWASEPTLFIASSPPAWVETWLTERAERAAKRAERVIRSEVADPAAQARRAAEREAKVQVGVEALALWIEDLMRQGLASAQERPPSFWEEMAARMMDAQAPGLARALQRMAALPRRGTTWAKAMLISLGQLHLLLQGYQRLDTLPLPLQEDIRALIGFPQSQEAVAGEEGIQDRWQVVGQREVVEGSLRVQRSWLWGRTSQQSALLLSYASGQATHDTSIQPGLEIEAELLFFPSAYPQRALIKARQSEAAPIEAMPGLPSVRTWIEEYGAALAQLPWIEQLPFMLAEVLPLQDETGWIVRDEHATALPLDPAFEAVWQLLALSGGYPITLMGEWDGSTLFPLSVWADGRFVALG